jgi:hypothetical protein
MINEDVATVCGHNAFQSPYASCDILSFHHQFGKPSLRSTVKISWPLGHELHLGERREINILACRDREGVALIRPEEVLAGAPPETRRLRLPFRWQVDVREGEKLHGLWVEPDRVLGLRFADAPEGRQVAYFFLEADRGTMPVARKGLGQTSFRRKLLSYRETWRQGLHKAHLGIPNFRVLTVTTSEERVRHLVEACWSLGVGGRLFLFAGKERFSHEDILVREWVNGVDEAVKLLG